MAIENSIAGSILPNYGLLDQYGLVYRWGTFAEHQSQSDGHAWAKHFRYSRSTLSPPMALLQCKQFFHAYPHIKLVESSDTAAVAKEISDNNQIGKGAIASQLAADLYGLQVISESIQTIKNNVTRFVIRSKIGNQTIQIFQKRLGNLF
ncbi:MAG: hypothetical protein CM15mP59_1660 [Flavobacteriaceae bacterium]|nr:MAG: hypothetical protein CM15mP59_1660 [Flavobacteriaceae bacterium]